MKALYALVLYFAAIPLALSQVTLKVTSVPYHTPDDATLYVSGSFEGWSGGQASYALTKNADGSYQITLPQQSGTISYKFTRSAWASVETSASGAAIANRTYTFGGGGATVNHSIATWADLPASPTTAEDEVRIMAEAFAMPQFNGRLRRVWMYLPPDYATSGEDYPVLYMHDAQNIFDTYTSFGGEWQADEAMNNLYAQGMKIIVVGIENGGGQRTNEYTPWPNSTYGGGDGEDYVDFIVQTLKPYVDANYRTKASQPNTGILGSSLGGLISHYAGMAYPNVFGKVGSFSPSFWFNSTCYTFAQQNANIQNQKTYFVAGTSEASTMVPNMNSMVSTMVNAGYPAANIYSEAVSGGTHSEGFWRSQFQDAVEWLYESSPGGGGGNGFTVYSKGTHIYYWNTTPAGSVPAVSWPGVAMTYAGDGWYSHTFPQGVSGTNLIFSNNGSSQTADLYRDEDGWYLNGQWYATQPSTGLTLHMYRPGTWSQVWLHYWNASNGASSAWPGVQMTDPDGDRWYSHTISGATSTNLLFHNNAGSQTANLTRTGEGWYYYPNWYNSNPLARVDHPGAAPTLALGNTSLYPNPTQGAATVKVTLLEAGPLTLTVVDAQGRQLLLLRRHLAAGEHALQLLTELWPKGLYHVQVQTNQEQRQLTVVRQ